ncbi:DUF817 domain-containing protein [Microbacterium esteraromaticum]|uniref:DUF817 domain-containing protein n=1 Tax=Microbacterium esteraromaticum TaxID=57043 RepID=A0A939ISY4_9MICO|nr:DUF817 domain-containing protein [Microbacterium esteraromaticum]MBN8205657.1 DUF817 domain-containing protein [Microbacterium esteraromaticum]MBN8415811.1 DUF817 domain-containing protein [Microbacterium esteraromaticum]
MQWGTALEQRIDAIADRMLQDAAARGARVAAIEFIVFVLKQAWACIFGAALLVALIAARLLYPDDAVLARNDALTLAAVLIQVAMLVFGLETVRELRVIVLFHITGTVMELFKTDVGSWAYAAEGVLRIGGVPLFSGFMYAAVGSYMVRVYRLFDLRFSRYPRRWLTAIVAAAIYVNFFTHHFWWDARWVLFGAVVVLWGGTVMHARIRVRIVRLPLLLVFAGVALFLWAAENIGTWAGAWVYPDQVAGWQLVSLSKMGSWFLLMIISVVLVAWVYPPRAPMASSPEAIEAPPVQQERPR